MHCHICRYLCLHSHFLMHISVNFVDENYDEKYSLTTFFPWLRRDENGYLKIKTMTKSILTFVNETKMLVVDEVTIFLFLNLHAPNIIGWMLPGSVSILHALPDMLRHTSEALTAGSTLYDGSRTRSSAWKEKKNGYLDTFQIYCDGKENPMHRNNGR